MLPTHLSESRPPPSAPQLVRYLPAHRLRLPPEGAALDYEHLGHGGRGDLLMRATSFAGVPAEK